MENISHMGMLGRNVLVKVQVTKFITESEGRQVTREIFHRRNYLSNSMFNVIN